MNPKFWSKKIIEILYMDGKKETLNRITGYNPPQYEGRNCHMVQLTSGDILIFSTEIVRKFRITEKKPRAKK